LHIRRGKPIDSERLKRDLDKRQSVVDARTFSRGITPGSHLDACPICQDQQALDIVEIYNYLYRECSTCGTAFVANPPSENDLRAAYSSDYYTTANQKLYANDAVIDYRVKAIAEPKVDFVMEHIATPKKTWLDIGCGVGEILFAAKNQGFQTLGIEANAMEADYARQRFGIEVRNEYVSARSLGDYVGRWGIVSLFSVIEHVLSPNAIIKDIASIQEKGDYLVLEVPHYPSISAFSQMTFPDHINRMMHPPLHLFLFPLKALSRILGSCGYEIRAAWFFGQDFFEMFNTLGLFVETLNGSPLHRAISPLMNEFQQVIDESGLSDEVLVVAEKTS
jgi:2-polyprenyl-3-methyl-5-hydroxy-6-metoxy-1,4-benzoquinol methylase